MASPASVLPAVNAGFNALSAVLLVAGWLLIRAGKRQAHRNCMLGALASSACFLAGYLYYHARAGHVVYHGPARPLYLFILLTHTVLAAVVLPLLWRALLPALRGQFEVHAPRARLLLPVWLYVSVTGVIVYAMLYHL